MVVKNGAILAAGTGSRMKEYYGSLPKPLIELNGVSLIERVIGGMVYAGITNVFCITNNKFSHVEAFVKRRHPNLNIRFIIKNTESSMHSLYELKEHLQGDNFLLSMVDSIMPLEDIKRLINKAGDNKSADMVLGIANAGNDENPLFVEVDKDDRIISIGEDTGKSNLVTAGIYLCRPSILEPLEYSIKNNISRMRNFLRYLVINNYLLYSHYINCAFDIDDKEDIIACERMLVKEDYLY